MDDDSPRLLGRRQVLAGIGTTAGIAALAGCSALWEQTGAMDVVAHNAASGTRTVSVTITADGAEEAHTSRSLVIDPGETVDPVNRSKLPTNTDYSVDVAVEDGPSETFEWTDPTVERAPLWVFVDGTRNVKFLLQSG